MNTLGQAMKELESIDLVIGIGMQDGKIAVEVKLNDAVLYWNPVTARKVGQEWIKASLECMESSCGVSALQLKFGKIDTLIAPEGLLQAAFDINSAACLLMGVGVVHTWLEDSHGFGIDAEAVCASIQPKDPESLSS